MRIEFRSAKACAGRLEDPARLSKAYGAIQASQSVSHPVNQPPRLSRKSREWGFSKRHAAATGVACCFRQWGYSTAPDGNRNRRVESARDRVAQFARRNAREEKREREKPNQMATGKRRQVVAVRRRENKRGKEERRGDGRQRVRVQQRQRERIGQRGWQNGGRVKRAEGWRP